MTSIMHPGTYARANAVQAKEALQNAANVLRHDGPRPFEPLPSHGGTGFASPFQEAMIFANGGINKLTTALGVQTQLGAGAVSALTRAREEALSGVRALNDTKGLHDPKGIVLTFDASSMWIDLAVNLIDLDMHGRRPPVIDVPRPGVPPMPPVTIQPVPGPGEPGSPITIQPIMPEPVVTPEWPPIEVEAPEAIGA